MRQWDSSNYESLKLSEFGYDLSMLDVEYIKL